MNLQETTIISMQGMMIWNALFFLMGVILTLLIKRAIFDNNNNYYKGYEDGMNNANQIFNEVFRKS